MPINQNNQSFINAANASQNTQTQNIQNYNNAQNAQAAAIGSLNNNLLITAPTPREIIYRVEDAKKSQAMYVSETIAEQVEVGQVYIRSDQVAGPNITTLTADEILQLKPDKPEQFIQPTVGGGVSQTGPTAVVQTQNNFVGYLGSNTKFTFALIGDNYNNPELGVNIKYPTFSGPKPTTAPSGAPTEILDNIQSNGGITINTNGDYIFKMGASFTGRKIWMKKGIYWGAVFSEYTGPDALYIGAKIIKAADGSELFVKMKALAGTNSYIAKNTFINNAKDDNWNNLQGNKTYQLYGEAGISNLEVGDIIKPYYMYTYGIGTDSSPKSITEVVNEQNIVPEFTTDNNYTYFQITKTN